MPAVATRKPQAPQQPLGQLLVGSEDEMAERASMLLEQRAALYRDAIVKRGRSDALCKLLGYDVVPGIHDRIIKAHARFSRTLTLGFRGCGKTYVGTVRKAIEEILRNRDVRIVISSKTGTLAESILRDIKTHFETNEALRAIFGDYVGDEIWSNQAILVKGARNARTPTLTAVGVEGTMVGLHPDIIIIDDPIDDENSRSSLQRERIETWIRKVAIPALNPRTPERPWADQLHVFATRYHPKDIAGVLAQEMHPDQVLVIKPRRADGSPVWPERFSDEKLKEMRKELGLIAYESQMNQNVTPMASKFFELDHCQILDWDLVPADGLTYMGVDFASGLDPKNDRTAMAVVRMDPNGARWVIDARAGRWRVREQIATFMEMYRAHRPVRIGVESVGYQAVAPQLLVAKAEEDAKQAPTAANKETAREVAARIVPLDTKQSKEQRAIRLQPEVEQDRLMWAKGTHEARDEFLQFPDGDHDDYFDAVEMAFHVSRRGVVTNKPRTHRKAIVYGRPNLQRFFRRVG